MSVARAGVCEMGGFECSGVLRPAPWPSSGSARCVAGWGEVLEVAAGRSLQMNLVVSFLCPGGASDRPVFVPELRSHEIPLLAGTGVGQVSCSFTAWLQNAHESTQPQPAGSTDGNFGMEKTSCIPVIFLWSSPYESLTLSFRSVVLFLRWNGINAILGDTN